VHASGSISAVPDTPGQGPVTSAAATMSSMPNDRPEQDEESLRARSEQAIGEIAQALLDSQVLEGALAAAFGAREKAVEAQQAAMAALNLPSAGDVERLERRVRSLSQRLEEVEDQVDDVLRELRQTKRQLAAREREQEPDSNPRP
jgi:uncharacterized protein Yka (UPF0111/DUF47 family)